MSGQTIDSGALLASGRREQYLVNAQVEVNRAVFLMNQQRDRDFTDLDVSDSAICGHIELAIHLLNNARQGYIQQGELDLANAPDQRTPGRTTEED